MKMTKILKAALGYFKRLINDAIAEYRWQKAQRQAAQRVASVKSQYPDCEGAMNAVWPPASGTTTGYEVDGGVTTIRWGTDGLVPISAGSATYYICTRFSQKELVDAIKLPNGTGLTSTRVRIRDGIQWSVTVRDDTAWTAPVVGDAVTVVDAGGFISSGRLTYQATVVDNDYDTAVKQPGERVLVLERLVLIETAVGTAQAA